MSYDLEVYSAEEPPSAGGIDGGRGWQIVADGPLRVEPDDIPASVQAALPGIRFLTRLHLEGDAPQSAHANLIALARGVAKSARGVVVNQQEGTIETPRGVQRLQFDDKGEDTAPLQVSWFSDEVKPFAEAVPTTLLDTFQRILPECLPRRYGLFEPPQFKLETTGLDHLRKFLREHLTDTIVWYGQKPCQYVFVSVPDAIGPTRKGYRCARLSVELDGRLSQDPAWRVQVSRLWLAVADLVRPFYAEIRLGTSPTKGWWWNGIPRDTPSSALLGGPYVGLWPAFTSAAESTSTGLLYVDRFAGGGSDRAAAVPPSPPVEIAQPEDGRQTFFDSSKPADMAALLNPPKRPYPPVWPFNGPFS